VGKKANAGGDRKKGGTWGKARQNALTSTHYLGTKEGVKISIAVKDKE